MWPRWLLACVLVIAACCTPHVRRTASPTPSARGAGLPAARGGPPELVVQSGRQGTVSAIAIAPNDEWIALGGASGVVGLYELSSGSLVRRFHHRALVTRAVFSPDGRTLLTGTTDGVIQLWDVATGARLRLFAQGQHSVSDLGFSADGRRVFGVGDHVSVWDAETARLLLSPDAAGDVRAAAFSPDGSRVATALWTGEVRLHLVDEPGSAKTVAVHPGGAFAVAFSLDGQWLVTGGNDGVAALIQVETGSRTSSFTGHTKPITSVAISPDQRFVLTASEDTARMWKVADGTSMQAGDQGLSSIRRVAFSSSGEQVLIAGMLRALLVDVRSEQDLLLAGQSGAGGSGAVEDFAFTRKCDKLVVGFSDGVVRVVDLPGGRVHDPFVSRVAGTHGAVFSPDEKLLVTGNNDGSLTWWDLKSGTPRRDYLLPPLSRDARSNPNDPVTTVPVAFDATGEHLLVRAASSARLLETRWGNEVQRFPSQGTVALSPDGQRAITGSQGKIRLWDARSGAEIRSFGGYRDSLQAVAFSADGQRALTGDYRQEDAQLWDLSTGTPVQDVVGGEPGLTTVALWGNDDGLAATGTRWGVVHVSKLGDAGTPAIELRHPPGVTRVRFSPDGREVLTAGGDRTARRWDAQNGVELQRFTSPSRLVLDASMTRDSRWVATVDVEGNTILWDTKSGREAVRLLSLNNGGWVVVAPDGRFDAADLEENMALDWIVPDDPMRLLPIEIFMRDYYEPQLLSRILAGDPLPAVRDLSELNRVQPQVELSKITLEPSGETVTVEVTVENAVGAIRGIETRSGMNDLRVFRDRQLVAYADGALRPTAGEQRATFRFDRIKLPRLPGKGYVRFSAHAFNVDGVKSTSASRQFRLPEQLRPRSGRAYLVTFGVNAFTNPAWRLDYAVNDAEGIGEHLERALRASQQFEDVVRVSLVSDTPRRAGTDAGKETLQAVFEILAGGQVSDELRQRIPNADRLRVSQPEDLVLVAVSTHGYADKKGVFHIFPENIGTGTERVIDDEVLRHTISSDDLRDWWRPVDGREMFLIIDACHSAAAVAGNGDFKPGPWGSRGLGQLAYDKGIRVLVASQTTDSTVESSSLKHGLLTYALVEEGLDAGLADHAPKDGELTLDEWLAYAVQRVPKLYSDVLEGKVHAKGVELVYGHQDQLLQSPVLFDFTRSHSNVKLPSLASPEP